MSANIDFKKTNYRLRKFLSTVMWTGIFFLALSVLSVPIGIFFGFLLGIKIFSSSIFLFIVIAFIYNKICKKIENEINSRINNQ